MSVPCRAVVQSRLPQAGESIPVHRWNSPQGGQVHYTDAAAEAWNNCGWSLARSRLPPGDIKSRWRHNWKSAQVVNSHLVCDPTIRQPGFDLSRQQWSLLNHFCTEQGHCCACKRKWRLTDTDLSLWRDPDSVPHCRILSPDKTEWRLISATLCGNFVTDQLWFMTCMQEEEDWWSHWSGRIQFSNWYQ